MRVVAEVAGDEVEQAGLLADVAVGSDAVAFLHAGSIVQLAECFDAFEFVV
jgi:hypothetical protein